jgi:hypothetical protein
VRFNPSPVIIPNGPDDDVDWGDTRPYGHRHVLPAREQPHDGRRRRTYSRSSRDRAAAAAAAKFAAKPAAAAKKSSRSILPARRRIGQARKRPEAGAQALSVAVSSAFDGRYDRAGGCWR